MATPTTKKTTPPKATKGAAKKTDGSAQRSLFLQTLSTLKEDPDSILPNDYVERVFPTGSIVLDHVLGIGGFPCHGRMIQVHGEEHSGKSTMEYCAAAAYQREFDEPVMIFDFEGQLKTEYLRACGMNMDPAYLQIRIPDSLDECLRVVCELLESKACKCFIFDSVAWMVQGTDLKEIRKGKSLDSRPGEHAKLFKKFLHLLIPRARRADAIVMFVNQQVGVIPQTQQEQNAVKYATVTNLPYNITGGKAARYTPSLMLETSKGKAFEGANDETFWLFPAQDDNTLGRQWKVNQTKVRVLKNKISGGGYRQYHLYIRPGGGIDDLVSVRELANHYGLFSKGKGGYIVGDDQNVIATYRTKAECHEDLVIKQNPEVLAQLRELVITYIQRDNKGFAYEKTLRDKFVAGEIDADELPPEIRGQISLEGELGSDDIDIELEA